MEFSSRISKNRNHEEHLGEPSAAYLADVELECSAPLKPFRRDKWELAPSGKCLIQPLVSTDAMAELTPVVPHLEGWRESENTSPSPSRRLSLSRIRQVVLTSAPLIAADLFA